MSSSARGARVSEFGRLNTSWCTVLSTTDATALVATGSVEDSPGGCCSQQSASTSSPNAQTTPLPAPAVTAAGSASKHSVAPAHHRAASTKTLEHEAATRSKARRARRLQDTVGPGEAADGPSACALDVVPDLGLPGGVVAAR